MYLKLLEDAVLEEQGKKQQIRTDCSADLTVSAHIPETYVRSPEQRMDLYRRMAAVRSAEDSGELLDELLDRYGNPPASVLALLDVALLRASAADVGVTDITQKGRSLVFSLGPRMDVPSLMAVCGKPQYRSLLMLSAGDNPHLTLVLKEKEDILKAAGALVEELRLKSEEQAAEENP